MNTTLQMNPFTQAKKTRRQWKLFVLLALFCTVFSYAQLPNFTLHVNITDETCPGNGSLEMLTPGTDPAATVTYVVYALPNTTSPIANSTVNTISGLVHGDYRIVATQTLAGNTPNSQTTDVTIANLLNPLVLSPPQVFPAGCINNGSVTINTSSGVPVSYEILSGPVAAGLQSSPVFGGLAAGTYVFRVYDNCGDASVVTYLVGSVSGSDPSWGESQPSFLVSCSQITLTNSLTPGAGSSLAFPITVVYTVNPPGGAAPIVQTITMASGDVAGQEFITTFPYYENTPYSYSVAVTDACGNHYDYENIQINKPFKFDFNSKPGECGEYYISFALANFIPPVTVNFLSAPAGFVPVDFNAAHPGPYSADTISYGSSLNPVPYGYYNVELTDGCGRTVTKDHTVEFVDPNLTILIDQHAGCDSFRSAVKFAITGYKIVSASITAGPVAYSAAYPVDVSSFIDPVTGEMIIDNMPTGTYSVTVTDDCGNVYNEDFTIAGLDTKVSSMMWPGCEDGMGSIRIRGEQIELVSVILTAAPAAYGQTLPYDVSFNISPDFKDTFSMNNFPPGDYTFKVYDNCGLDNTVTVTVTGFAIIKNTYSIIPHCGSFDLEFHFDSGTSSTFWLQRFDPVTGTWGHPQTGVPYLPGDTPDADNATAIINYDGINYNIPYIGDFRIIHRFQSFENGSVGLFRLCSAVVQEFTFENEIEITEIQKVTCNGINSDVSVTAIGVAPLTYEITSMNSMPFYINNGHNNIFANLQPAVYNFQVRDICGNISGTLTDVALLPSLVNISQPGNMVECDGPDHDNKADFRLTDQNLSVLGGAPPGNFTITYHLSAPEAATGSNPLPDVYNSESREIFCRMQYTSVGTCFDITSFFVTVNEYPVLNMELAQTICEGQQLTINADPGLESYLWSTGETTPSITVDTPGIYTVEVTLTQNSITCTALYTVNVVLSQPATIHHIETSDWTNEENTISVIIDQPSGNYSFSLDNVHFQTSNTFYGLAPGLYTVYIKDGSGCDGVSQQVYLLAYPKFFTPNNDGYNDFWQVFYAKAEPNLKVYIFDRYGKLLTGFGSESMGWDGKYNGRELPSTDYWFLVIRQDGNEHRGHFAMKR